MHAALRFTRATDATSLPTLIHTTQSTPNTTLLSRPTIHQHFHSPRRTSSRFPSTHLHPRPSSTHLLATSPPRPSCLVTTRLPFILPHTTPYATCTQHLLYPLRYATPTPLNTAPATRYAIPTPLATAHITLRPYQPRYATPTPLATAPATRYATPTPLASTYVTRMLLTCCATPLPLAIADTYLATPLSRL
ncbi:hypothetical protein Pcinc_025374 [Petrolisthes cinctipes]|uniref:Uncharacterized protein n=1 Tax=Petrolisthes cinctipes TaxID=88211 RepID=A0AAE1FA33_PETCI|nr:hypothetical protein Pcinc_025374 [Petrolisthes cinctipes]